MRIAGSNLSFGGLSDEWQEYLTENTVEHFDTYEVSMLDAAASVISAVEKDVVKNPAVMNQNRRKLKVQKG